MLSRYEDRQAALLPALHIAHEVRGYLSPETMDEVAERLDLPPAYVRGVTTFYTMYNLQPLGRYLIQVCTNISCNLCGGEEVLQAFLEHTGTDMGEISRRRPVHGDRGGVPRAPAASRPWCRSTSGSSRT